MSLLRLIEICLPVSVGCFVLTTAVSSVAIYVEDYNHCQGLFLGMHLPAELRYFSIYLTALIMIAFVIANEKTYMSRLQHVLDLNIYDVYLFSKYTKIKLVHIGIYLPILLFSAMAIAVTIISIVSLFLILTPCIKA